VQLGNPDTSKNRAANRGACPSGAGIAVGRSVLGIGQNEMNPLMVYKGKRKKQKAINGNVRRGMKNCDRAVKKETETKRSELPDKP